MADMEKQAHTNNMGGMSANNTLTNVHGQAGVGGAYPVGAENSAQYPFTLGASGPQQALYQGGLPLRKFANPAPL